MKKKYILGLAVLVVLCGLAVSFFDLSVFGQNRKLPIYSVCLEEKKIAISFDAAWGNDHTLPILDILDNYRVKTTFFLVKFWAEKYPDDVVTIAERGHEVENHSATHPDMTTLSVDQIKKELLDADSVIENLTRVKPRLFRPPFGAYNNLVIETIEEAGYKVIQWSVDSLDWKSLTAEQIVNRVLDKVKPGSIVLFHNHADHVEEYLPQILEGLQSQGYEIVPIGELIFWDNYSIDHAGQQIAK